MPKVDHGLIWSEDHADKSITIGFTQRCITEKLQECFHVLPADASEVREKGPLLVLETNDGLQSIKTPVAGKVAYFNPKARNFPDKLTDSDTIVTLFPKGYVAPPKAAAQKKVVNNTVNFDWYSPVGQTPTAPAPDAATQQLFAEMNRRNAERLAEIAHRTAEVQATAFVPPPPRRAPANPEELGRRIRGIRRPR